MTETADTGLVAEIAHEIEEVHRFLSDWFRGEVPNTDQAFAAGLRDRLAPGFENIQPAGRILQRDELLDAIEAGHGTSPAFRIAISDVRLRYASEDRSTVLATYVETQTGARQSAPENARISSVWMNRTADGTLQWLHIHETGVPTKRTTR